MVSKIHKLKISVFSSLTSSSFWRLRKRYVTKIMILLAIGLAATFFYLKDKTNELNPDNISLFLENVMIREGGLYTLVGSKPMTLFRVYPEISNFSRKPSFIGLKDVSQKEVEQSFQYLLGLEHLKHDKLWEAWVKKKSSLNSSTYILSTRAASYSGRPMGIFINIPNLLYVLSSNQELFEKETGISFDPESILGEVGSDSSEFWNRVFENHYLLGILLGYGKQSSFIFNWMNKLPPDLQDVPIRKMSKDYNQSGSVRYNKKIKVKDLTLPEFYYFSIFSEDLDKYKKERDLIINEFEGKQFNSKVLEYLTES